MINILLKCILWYEFLNDLNAQSDFWQKNCHKKAGQVEPFLSFKYALAFLMGISAPLLYFPTMRKYLSNTYGKMPYWVL